MNKGKQEKVSCDVKSDKTCKCGKRIKMNVAMRKTAREIDCPDCHTMKEAGRGHFIGKYGKPRKKRIEAGLQIKKGSRIG